MNKSIFEIHDALMKGEVTPLDLVLEAIENAKNDDNNAFEYISEKEAIEAVKNLDVSKKGNLLWGIPFTLKDNFSTKDIPTCASSKILEGYVPVFSCEVYERLKEQGAILIGKTTLDEIAMSGTGLTGHLGKTFNPWDKTHQRIIGGSSCGSASTCASGVVPFSIGSDTGDSVRKPASYGGLVGFKPTWGRISRFGLFPFAPSLDHVAYFTRNIRDSAVILNNIAGKDEKDMTSSNRPVEDYLEGMNKSIKGLKVAVIKEIYDTVTNKVVRNAFEATLKKLKEQGVVIDFVHMDERLCKAIYPTYIILSSAEATSSNANFDGIKFGKRWDGKTYEEIVHNTRTNGFSSMIKKRFIIGSYSLLKENQEEVYLRVQKCRHLIVDAVNNILKDHDVIYLPASPRIAPTFDEAINMKISDERIMSDSYLEMANFSGQPSLTLPIGFDKGMPLGGNITGRIFEESTVLALGQAIENITGLANIVADK